MQRKKLFIDYPPGLMIDAVRKIMNMREESPALYRISLDVFQENDSRERYYKTKLREALQKSKNTTRLIVACYGVSILWIFMDRPSVCVCLSVCLSKLSCLYCLTFDFDLWHGGQP